MATKLCVKHLLGFLPCYPTTSMKQPDGGRHLLSGRVNKTKQGVTYQAEEYKQLLKRSPE